MADPFRQLGRFGGLRKALTPSSRPTLAHTERLLGRGGKGRSAVGDELEARAAQDAEGTVDFRIVLEELRRRQIVFEFQDNSEGNGVAVGGFTVDFLVTSLMPWVAIDVKRGREPEAGLSIDEGFKAAALAAGGTVRYGVLYTADIRMSRERLEVKVDELLGDLVSWWAAGDMVGQLPPEEITIPTFPWPHSHTHEPGGLDPVTNIGLIPLSIPYTGAPVIPGAAIKYFTFKSTSSAVFNVGTVPKGKKWLIPGIGSTQTARVSNSGGAVGRNGSLVFQSSADQMYLHNSTSISDTETAAVGPSVPLVLEPGDILQFAASGARIFIHIAVYEFPATFPLKSVWIKNPAGSQATLYTLPKGKTAVTLGLGVYNDTGSNRTMRLYIVPKTNLAVVGTVTCTKQAGGSAAAGTYTVFVRAVDTLGRTSATQGNTTVTTETTNLTVRAAFAAVNGASWYDVYCSTDGAAAKFVGRVTEAQRASGIKIDAQDSTAAGGTAGAVDVEVAGTGPAANASADDNDVFDHSIGILPANSGFFYALNITLRDRATVVIEPTGSLGNANGICWMTLMEYPVP